MKYLILVYLMVAVVSGVRGQLPGFPLHANGLLYDDTLMARLKHLADSARSHPRPGKAQGTYFSLKQTTGRRVRVDTGDVYGALEDLRRGITYTAFVGKYPQAGTDNEVLIMLDERQGYRVAGNAAYYAIPLQDVYYSASDIVLPTDEHYRPVANVVNEYGTGSANAGINGNCVYRLSSTAHMYRGKYSTAAYVFAFFLDSFPAATPLTGLASELVGWRDRMVDTATGVYDKDAQWTSLDFENLDFGPAQKVFDAYVGQVNPPYTDSLSMDTVFRRLLAAAIAEVRDKRYYPFIYMERYMDAYAPQAALEIRRRWRPVAMDNFDELTPRFSTMHIAYLAGELGNWQVFLQAQLALAIDPWGHHPDLSRPGYRNSFLRELEALNIDVDDILLANELTSPWPDANFYRAKTLGRALALEGGNRQALEETVLKLIADAGLDVYHRLAMHYLFLNYVSFLPADPGRSKVLARLEQADETLPGYLIAKVKVREQDVDNHRDVRSW